MQIRPLYELSEAVHGREYKTGGGFGCEGGGGRICVDFLTRP